jgi:16S rRNA (cytidine1402-2'-O)-methyltransferase
MVGSATSCHHRIVTGTLFLVGTPIGNLADLTPRARETLSAVDLIAAEDTRRTGRLLSALDIAHGPLVSFFEGNERERTAELLERLRGGSSVAVVVDGGMPGVSDPGYRLVRDCAAAGVDVRVVPGPSAAIAALVVSGLPTDRFVFEGFLPRKTGERKRRLESLGAESRTVVCFESPRRVRTLLRDIVAALGDRRVAVAREMTKLHEEVLRGKASVVLSLLGDVDPKGEVVVVIEGATLEDPAGEASDLARAADEARDLVASGMRRRDAARASAKRHGVPVNVVYGRLVGDGHASEPSR